MSDNCCQGKTHELRRLAKQQGRVLWIVLSINAVMFVVELLSGIFSNSIALTGDSLDMLGDSIAYGSSLYALDRDRSWQAKTALLKGSIMFLSAIAVFARAIYQAFFPVTPEFSVMGAIGFLALVTNVACAILLFKHRDDNINMSSVWLCSCNDLIANTSVLMAAALVFMTGEQWPDLAVGLLVTFVFAKSAGKVLSQAWRQLKVN